MGASPYRPATSTTMPRSRARIGAHFVHRTTDARAHFDLGTQEFGTDLPEAELGALFQQRRRRIAVHLAGVAVDQQIFFFDADGERRLTMIHTPPSEAPRQRSVAGRERGGSG